MPTDTFNKVNPDKKSWRDRAKEARPPFNPEYKLKEQTHPSTDDTVMNHPENDSVARITDEGVIEFFVSNNTGLRIDPDTESIQFFGDKFKSMTTDFHIHCDEERFMWNYMPVNDALRDPFTELVTANCAPDPASADTLYSGTDMMKRMLTTTGAYVGTSGPVEPGTASVIDSSAVGLEGKRAYSGIEELNQIRETMSGLSDILGDAMDTVGT